MLIAEASDRGRPLTLRYQAWDDSGRAKVDISIRNKQKATVASFHIPLRSVIQGQWYSVTWQVPKTAAHKVLNFCVRATDAALRQLPGKQRAAIYLRFYEDMPYEEVASVMGIPAVTARSLVHRGLKRLAAALGEEADR